MSVFIRRYCKTAVFTSLLKVPIPISSFMSEVYNGRFVSEFSLSMLKEIIALVGGYLSKTRKYKANLAEKYMWKWTMKSFSNEKLNFLFRKLWASYIWDLARNFEVKEFWALENHININMILCSSLSQRYIYTLVQSSKLLAYLLHVCLI